MELDRKEYQDLKKKLREVLGLVVTDLLAIPGILTVSVRVEDDSPYNLGFQMMNLRPFNGEIRVYLSNDLKVGMTIPFNDLQHMPQEVLLRITKEALLREMGRVH